MTKTYPLHIREEAARRGNQAATVVNTLPACRYHPDSVALSPLGRALCELLEETMPEPEPEPYPHCGAGLEWRDDCIAWRHPDNECLSRGMFVCKPIIPLWNRRAP